MARNLAREAQITEFTEARPNTYIAPIRKPHGVGMWGLLMRRNRAPLVAPADDDLSRDISQATEGSL